MNIQNFAIYVCLAFAVTLTACNKEKTSEPSAKTDPVVKADDVAKPVPDGGPVTLLETEKSSESQAGENKSPLNSPKNSLSYQMKLLSTGWRKISIVFGLILLFSCSSFSAFAIANLPASECKSKLLKKPRIEKTALTMIGCTRGTGASAKK